MSVAVCRLSHRATCRALAQWADRAFGEQEAASAFDGAGLDYPLIHLAEFKDAFKAHADKGQKLDSRALGTAMRALGQAPTELELQKLIDDAAVQEIDAAGNVHESIGFKASAASWRTHAACPAPTT